MDVTTFDYVLMAVLGALAVIGLFKGLSGWLGTFVGLTTAICVGYFGFGCCFSFTVKSQLVSEAFVPVAAAVMDFLVSLIAFGFARLVSKRFFSFLLPQPLDAIVGMLGGLVLWTVVVVLLAGTAFFEGGKLSDGFIASKSRIVHRTASAMDVHVEGLPR